MKTKFYTVNQNNSGGYNIRNNEVDKFVCVEAQNVEQAKNKFKDILRRYREFCPCCGERWDDYYLDEDDGYDSPTIYGDNYKEINDEHWCFHSNIIIYYLNGEKEIYDLTQNIKRG